MATGAEEHLFNLKSALKLYDMTQREIAAYEARILEEIQALQPVERRDQPVPKHPNGVKEKAIRRRGGHHLRTELWRFAGVDLTRIDGIGTESALTLLDRSRPRPDGVPLGEALCVLAAPGSANGPFPEASRSATRSPTAPGPPASLRFCA